MNLLKQNEHYEIYQEYPVTLSLVETVRSACGLKQTDMSFQNTTIMKESAS